MKKRKRNGVPIKIVESRRSFEKFVTRLESSRLFGRVEARALNMHVSLQDLYEGPHSPSVVAARRSVYLWLAQEGKSLNEIAHLFDRSTSGISKLLRDAHQGDER